MTTSNEPVRLNILALPNQQKVIVVMLALVLFGTLLAISSTVPANLFVFLAIVLLFLSFRRVLTRYEAEVQQLGLRQAGSAFAPLEQHLQHLAREYFQMERLPKLAIASKACDLHIVATWRRWYVALDVPQAERMQTMLADPTQHPIVDAILLHELGHLKHSDHIWIEYVRALLEVGTRLMLWFSLLLIGMTILLALINRSFFTVLNPQLLGAIFERYLPGTGDAMIENLFGSVEEFDRVAELARNIDFGQVLLNIIANTLPYLLIGLMLRAIYWQWLMRIREYYADAGAVQVLEDTGPLFGAIGQNAQSLSSSAQKSNLFTSIAQVIKAFIKGLERIYLRSGERAKLLFSPQQLNGPPASYGLMVGFYVLCLTLILSSTGALFLVGTWPMHFPVIAAVLLVSLYLLAPLILGESVWPPFWKALLVIVGIHGGMIVLSLALLVVTWLISPTLMLTIIERAARGMAWYTRINPELVTNDATGVLLTAAINNLLQIPVVLFASAGTIWLIMALAQRMLTWYGLPNAAKHLMHMIMIMFACVIALVSLVLLPIITDVILFRFAELASFGSPIYWGVAALTLVVVAALVSYGLVLDQRYGRRCPTCGHPVVGSFVLGKTCPTCKAVLHPWLGATYRFGKWRSSTTPAPEVTQ